MNLVTRENSLYSWKSVQLPVYGSRDAARAMIKREALLPVIREKRSASAAAASVFCEFLQDVLPSSLHLLCLPLAL